MGILSETYIFYADVYFVQNFIIKIAVLYFTLYCSEKCFGIMNTKRAARLVAVAFLGTIVEIIGLMIFLPFHFWKICVSLLEVPLMIKSVIGRNKITIKMLISSYGFMILINAILEILWNIFGVNGGYIFFLVIACCIAIIGFLIWKREEKIQKGIYEIVLIHEGNQVVAKGLYDSGNRLVDPYTKKGVHIIAEDLIKKLGAEKDKKVCVPYQSLGKENGVIEVYYIDRVCVQGQKEVVEQLKCPLGVTKDNLFKNMSYKIILNAEVF